VRKGRFREDLYYRLRVVEIVVPPLRERPEDVAALAALFAERMAGRLKRPARPFSAGALAAMSRHGWHGNVRELRHAVEQAVVLAAGEAIEEADLRLPPAGAGVAPPAVATGTVGAASGALKFAEAKQRAVEGLERAWLQSALAEHGGNVSRT